jgi:type II secretory pathway component GspD/PulD (secretin)
MRHRAKGRSVLAAFLAAGLALGSGGQEDSPKEQAAALSRKARKAAKANDAANAYLLYSEASALEPSNKKLKQKMEALQSLAALASKAVPPANPSEDDALLPPPALSPEDVFDSLTAREYAAAREPVGPPQLNGRPGKQDFDIRGNARSLFDQVTQRFGLQNVFDGDYPQGGQQIRFRVPGVDFREALHDLEALTNSFVIPFSAKLFMVAQDTPQKRTDLEQTMVVSIPVPEALTVQELTEIAQAVKQVVNIDKLAFDNSHNAIVIRDRISRVLPAQALLEQLMRYRPEVMIELEFLEVSESDVLNYGFNVTNQFNAIPLGRILNNIVTFPSGTAALVSFGGGKTLIGLTVAQVQAMFNETASTSKTLYRASVRSVDGQAATFHVGEKYPIITQQYAGAIPSGAQGSVFAPPPSFTFENLGAEVKVTPKVHGDEGVTLAVETSFELLAGQSVNSIPVIGRREFKASVHVTDGEWSIVAGMLSPTESKATSGFLGLAQMPLLGNLFRTTTKNQTRENLLIAIRPHLLSLAPNQTVTRELRVGSDSRPFNPL